jgi:hypothetical protein
MRGMIGMNVLTQAIYPWMLVVLLLGGCSATEPWVEPDDYIISLDGRTTRDSNGIFHLKLMRDRYQTVHRITGTLLDTAGKAPYQPQKVWWESSHVWYFTPGDTVITIYRRNVNDQGQWVIADTAAFVASDSMAVPTVNPSSYSDGKGEINTMIGPIPMLGDTMTIQCMWTSQWYKTDTVRAVIRLLLE